MAHYERTFNGDIGLGAVTGGKRIVIRNSDDFGLERPNVHRDHIRHNIYNSLLTSNLCFVPDADMFMTSAQWPDYHATLRAFFNGPMLLADKPGNYDPEILRKLIGLCPATGRYEVVRTAKPIRPLCRNVWQRFLEDGVGPALKGACYFPNCGSANIVLWNCRADAHDAAVDLILATDLLDALEVRPEHGELGLAIWSSNASKAMSFTVKNDNAASPVLSNYLPPKSAEILTIAPYHSVGDISVANLGLIDKYAGLAAISESVVIGTRLCTQILYQGVLGFLISRDGNYEKNFWISVNGEQVHFTAVRLAGKQHLVKVDLNNIANIHMERCYSVQIGV
jgi:hypothetical protein